ncbi:MAG: PEP/pyruvate-binding domain-containing protein, partial [Chloroflexota bacterium]
MSEFITPLSQLSDHHLIGRKAASLSWLHKNGALVPKTLVCTTKLYNAWKQTHKLPTGLANELDQYLQKNRTYAIRSSGTLEDLEDKSFAGQYATLLDVRGISNIKNAVQKVLESTNSEQLTSYLNSSNIETSHISMAVIIQEMVKPVVSGVAFTKNPITGFDEILIEAIEGTGDQLVQGVVTPARWVYKWGKWITAPSLDETILTEDQINLLRTEIETIAEKYKQPADIEWVFDGESF